MSLVNRNRPRSAYPTDPSGFPPPVTPGQGHYNPPSDPPEPRPTTKKYIWLAGILWSLLTTLSVGAGWVFGLGAKSADYAQKIESAKIEIDAERAANHQLASEVQGIYVRLATLDANVAHIADGVKELRADIKELGPIHPRLR